jgi:hypothetical protein
VGSSATSTLTGSRQLGTLAQTNHGDPHRYAERLVGPGGSGPRRGDPAADGQLITNNIVHQLLSGGQLAYVAGIVAILLGAVLVCFLSLKRMRRSGCSPSITQRTPRASADLPTLWRARVGAVGDEAARCK